MSVNHNLARVASLVSEPTRATIMNVLMDGRFHTASELAYMSGVKPQTASFHLTKMVEANIVKVEKQGRHRYFGMMNHEVAHIMESLLLLTPPNKVKSFKQSKEETAIRHARTCYDHLAGSLGVRLTEALLQSEFLHEDEADFTVTEKGKTFFSAFGIDMENLKNKRRSFSHKCLDWTERRHHLAGALGNALFQRFLELNWVQQAPDSRAVKITLHGQKGFKEHFSVDYST